MNTNLWIAIAVACAALPAGAQPVSARVAEAGPVSVVERGPHHRVIEQEVPEASLDGSLTSRRQSYTELRSFMHYLKDGQWQESAPEFKIDPEGYAVATRCAHTVTISPNLNDPSGAVDLVMPDGRHLRSGLLGLNLHDPTTGRTLQVAAVKNCAGRQTAPGEITFCDAFEGLKGSVRLRNDAGRFCQDVLLSERLTTEQLAQWGFAHPERVRLEVWTEFLQAPVPQVTASVLQSHPAGRQGTVVPDAIDQHLEFGGMFMPRGRAFAQEPKSGAPSVQPARSVPVFKQWIRVDGRSCLVEAANYLELLPLIGNLPASKMIPTGAGASKPIVLSGQRPPQRAAQPAAPVVKIAQLDTDNPPAALPQLVMDYELLQAGSVTNFTFKGDATYFVSGDVDLYGTTTIEGGAIVKYQRCASVNVLGPVVCLTGPYRPAVFTGFDDLAFGPRVADGTGTPTGWYATNALALVAGGDLKYLVFRYAYVGVSCGSTNFSLSDCQFYSCYNAVSAVESAFTNCNVLMTQVELPYVLSSSTGRVEHLTCDQAAWLAVDPSSPSTSALTLVNSITTGITNGYGSVPVVTDSTVDFASGAGVFQTAVCGRYYLADGSTNRNAGTTNLSAGLRAELRGKTTYPPAVYWGITLGGDLTFSPQIERDTNGPDRGWHYDVLDYIFSGAYLSNGVFTVLPGTAIGSYPVDTNQQCGLDTAVGSDLRCLGTSEAPVVIAHIKTVQEQSCRHACSTWNASVLTHQNPVGVLPRAQFQWTKWYGTGNEGHHFAGYVQDTEPISFNHCEFFSGGLITANPTLSVTNCFFHRVYLDIEEGWVFMHGSPHRFFNNLIYGGICMVGQDYENLATDWIFRDNVFDGVDMQIYAGPNICDHNAYIGALADHLNNTLQPTDIVLSTFAWQAGPLGDYYQPASSPLLGAGSRTADLAGLYHFTVTTNLVNGIEIKETNSVVDIGYHYVAVNASGVPVDTDGDGVPDYIEDGNGNGSQDPNEPPWGIAVSVQPAHVEVDLGSTATFIATASGTGPFTFAWRHNGTLLADCTDSVLTIADARMADAGTYTATATSSAGTATSSGAALAVWSPPMVAAGEERIFHLVRGRVVAWGDNQYGELGDGTFLDSDVPVEVVGLNNITKIAAGQQHALALDASGGVWAWGRNDYGQLGVSGVTAQNVPIRVPGLSDIKDIAAGSAHSVAVRADGTVWSWGGFDGGFGTSPTLVAGISSATAVAAGEQHTLALRSDGSVLAWGANKRGQLGNGSTNDSLTVPVQVVDSEGLPISVVSVSAGASHSLAVDANGTTWTWGDHTWGQCGRGDYSNGSGGGPPVKRLRKPTSTYEDPGAGVTYLSSAGQVDPSSLASVIGVAGGGSHSIAVDANGQVWTWGANWQGQLGVGPSPASTRLPTGVTLDNAVAVSANRELSAALDADANVWWWGHLKGVAYYPARAEPYSDPYQGTLPRLVVLGGANQTGVVNAEFAQPLRVRVTSQSEQPLVNVPVVVQVISGDLRLRTTRGGMDYPGLRLMTDAQGELSLIGFAKALDHPSCVVRVQVASGGSIGSVDVAETIVASTGNPNGPTVTLTGPSQGAALAPGSVVLTAEAADTAGTISQVEFFAGTASLGVATASPYTLAWNNVGVGAYDLTAVATDNQGLSATSAVVSITVAPARRRVTAVVEGGRPGKPR